MLHVIDSYNKVSLICYKLFNFFHVKNKSRIDMFIYKIITAP